MPKYSLFDIAFFVFGISFLKAGKYIRKTKKRHVDLNEKQKNELIDSLKEHYFCDQGDDYLNTKVGIDDLNDHVDIRLNMYRKFYIPWIESIHSFENAKILEVGCGTGASTVSIAEQMNKKGHLCAIDINAEHIKAAKKRVDLHGLDADFIAMDAAEISQLNKKFDIIIYPASLEHMTFSERKKTMQSAWKLLNSNGHLIIIDTPNRLWVRDNHTSFMPFFNWLPDDVAMEYSKFSARAAFSCIDFLSPENMQQSLFARWGRGISYHDIVLSIGEDSLKNVTGMRSFYHYPKIKFERLLKKYGGKEINTAFYERALNVAVKKL